jgi:hypothetical protein
MRALGGIREGLWKGGQKHLPKATLNADGARDEEEAPIECPVCRLQNDFGSTAWQQLSNQYSPAQFGYHLAYGHGGGQCWCQSGGVRRSCGLHCPNCDAQIPTYRSQLQQFARQGGQQLAVRQPTTLKLPVFEKTVRFLVTNKLEVFENSSIKALQIMGAHSVDLAAIETVHTQINGARFRKMLGMMLLNNDAILSILMPAASGKRSASAAAAASS